MRTQLLALTLLLGFLSACAGDPVAPATEDRTAPSSPSPNARKAPRSPEPSLSPSPQQPEQGARITAADSDFGTILFDDTGQAIYLFDVETTSEPRCYGPCAEAWPPVLTDGVPLAGEGVKASLLGTIQRSDGTAQVTYGGHPLYYYAHEGKHEVKCHDIFLNGGTWYAVHPAGRRAA